MQPHFRQQPPDQIVVWLYSLFVDKPGDHVSKPMQDCTGEEITQEWLYHLGVPLAQIGELAAYQLLGIERGVPEVFSSTYDIRTLLTATSRLRDGEEFDLPGPASLRTWLTGKLDETEIGELLTDSGLLLDFRRSGGRV